MLIDRYAWESPLRAWHPAEKLHVALTGLIVSFLCPRPEINWLIFGGFALVTISKGRVRAKDYGYLLLIPALFLLVGVITVMVTYQPALPSLCCWRVGSATWGISYHSLWQAELLASRSMAMVAIMYFLSLTTPIVELTSAWRAIRLPAILGDLMYLIYRGIYLLTAVAEQIVRAQLLRLGYFGWKRSFHSVALLVAAVFTHSLQRSHELTVAMQARGPAGEMPAMPLWQPLPWPRMVGYWVITVVSVCLMVLLD